MRPDSPISIFHLRVKCTSGETAVSRSLQSNANQISNGIESNEKQNLKITINRNGKKKIETWNEIKQVRWEDLPLLPSLFCSDKSVMTFNSHFVICLYCWWLQLASDNAHTHTRRLWLLLTDRSTAHQYVDKSMAVYIHRIFCTIENILFHILIGQSRSHFI